MHTTAICWATPKSCKWEIQMKYLYLLRQRELGKDGDTLQMSTYRLKILNVSCTSADMKYQKLVVLTLSEVTQHAWEPGVDDGTSKQE